MKKFITLLLLSFAVSTGQLPAETPSTKPECSQTGCIRIRVFDLRNHDGDLGIALFNEKKGFPGKAEKALLKGGVSSEGEAHVYVFENIPYGTYAVSVMHDENRNGKLDSNFIGIPKEGVGASNNPRSRFGPPSFDDASFQLDRAEVDLEIHLKYL
jgi:uncharacterized protein (DUF2141 family)